MRAEVLLAETSGALYAELSEKDEEMNKEYRDALKKYVRGWIRENPEGGCFDCWAQMDHQMRIVLVPDAFVGVFESVRAGEQDLANQRRGRV